MFFGKKLKEMRLKYAKMGIHEFKKILGTTFSASDFNNIEHGYVSPPDYDTFMPHVYLAFESCANKDQLKELNADLDELWRLRTEPFVMQMRPENVVISPLVHKTDGTRLNGEELIELNNHINDVAKEHNKIAKEHNKKDR